MKQPTIILGAMATIIIVCCVLLFLLWSLTVPVEAHQTANASLYQATPTIAPATPTVDPTVTALEKAKLAEEVTNLQNQNNWFWNFSATLLLVGAGAFGIFKYLTDKSAERKKQIGEQTRWLEDRESERDKRTEERFQTVVAGLGNEKMEARIGSAIVLRTFLASDYNQFYSQAFDLSVAYLRLPKSSEPLEETFRQALITVFKESFSLARDELKKQKGSTYDSQFLNAAGVQLDTAVLAQANLAGAWLPQASLQKASLVKAQLRDATLISANLERADLTGADLTGANLERADLTESTLKGTNFKQARLIEAHLRGAELTGAELQWGHLNKAVLENANLTGAHLEGAILIAAKLEKANLEGARLANANLEGANLKDANLRYAYLQHANLRGANLEGTHPETAKSLQDTDMSGVMGLSRTQLDTCVNKGATIAP